MKSSTSNERRSRIWACEVYPESAPDDWQDILRGLLLSGYISPLHDKDINDNGEPKKPHYHIPIKMKTVKTYDQMKEIVSQFGGVLQPTPLNSWEGYARYLIHKDNPEKAQYNPSDVISFGGLDYITDISNKSDKYGVVSDMITWINNNPEVHKCNYALFVTWCKDNDQLWFRALVDNCSYLIDKYLKSMSHMSKEKGLYIYSDKIVLDPVTGEVIDS